MHAKCITFENVAVFIDGTVLGITSPTKQDRNQRTVYNGHKKNIAFTFQAITILDVLCAHMYVPKVGCRHNMFLYSDYEVQEFLSVVLQLNQEQFVVHGDSGYSMSDFLEIPYEGDILEPCARTTRGKSVFFIRNRDRNSMLFLP